MNCSECLDKGWVFYAQSNIPNQFMRLHPLDANTNQLHVPGPHLIMEPCLCLVGQQVVTLK